MEAKSKGWASGESAADDTRELEGRINYEIRNKIGAVHGRTTHEKNNLKVGSTVLWCLCLSVLLVLSVDITLH